MRLLAALPAVLLAVSAVEAAEKYTGPRPLKADVPYLLHADNLVETEVGEASEESRKDGTVASLAGASSPAKTPLAEPIFIFKSEKIQPDKLTAWRLQTTKNGRREVFITAKKQKNSARPLHLIVQRLEAGLYKIEIDEPLENGEYTLSPDGSNQTFSFQIY